MGNPTRGSDGLPEVRDEAGDTPYWVPVVGLVLFAMVGIVMAIRATAAPEEPPEVQVAAAATPDDAPAPAEAAPEPEPAEAEDADSFGRNPGDEHFGHDHP